MVEKMVEPRNELVIVTGAGRGIGAAISEKIAERGYHVLINYAGNHKAAEAVASKIRAAGGSATTCQADVGTEAGIDKLFEAADKTQIPFVGLVNNAAISGGACRLEDLTSQALNQVLAINVAGTVICSRAAVKRMSIRHGGRGGNIVNISSIASKLGSPGEWIHYAASKGAIDSFTIGLGREVAREGIRVNAVSPGLVDTDFHAAAGVPDRVARVGPNLPLGRAGSPEEIANAVVWLMSDSASYITGAIIPVDGGR